MGIKGWWEHDGEQYDLSVWYVCLQNSERVSGKTTSTENNVKIFQQKGTYEIAV